MHCSGSPESQPPGEISQGRFMLDQVSFFFFFLMKGLLTTLQNWRLPEAIPWFVSMDLGTTLCCSDLKVVETKLFAQR